MLTIAPLLNAEYVCTQRFKVLVPYKLYLHHLRHHLRKTSELFSCLGEYLDYGVVSSFTTVSRWGPPLPKNPMHTLPLKYTSSHYDNIYHHDAWYSRQSKEQSVHEIYFLQFWGVRDMSLVHAILIKPILFSSCCNGTHPPSNYQVSLLFPTQ